MKKSLLLGAAICLLLSLCACTGAAHPSVPAPGRYTCTQISLSGGEWQPVGRIYAGPTYLDLDADGAGIFCVDGEAAAVAWDEADGQLTLTLGSERCLGSIDAQTVCIRFFDTDVRMLLAKPEAADAQAPAMEPAAPDYAASWAGDWYGWHVITDASESLRYLKNTAWDACARIVVDGASGEFIAWDTENEPGELLCRAGVTFSPGSTDAGCMAASSGTYLDCDITDGLRCDPGASDVSRFARMLCISGRAEDENGEWVRFRLYLRPWGMDWEDVRTGDTSGCLYRSMLPPGYDSWYAPLLAAHTAQMPDSFS